MTLAGCVGSLVSPLTWSHHIISYVPALVILVDSALPPAGVSGPVLSGLRGRRGMLALAAVIYATVTFSVLSLWEFNLHEQHGIVGFVLGNWFLWLLLAMLPLLPIRREYVRGLAIVGLRSVDGVDQIGPVDGIEGVDGPAVGQLRRGVTPAAPATGVVTRGRHHVMGSGVGGLRAYGHQLAGHVQPAGAAYHRQRLTGSDLPQTIGDAVGELDHAVCLDDQDRLGRYEQQRHPEQQPADAEHHERHGGRHEPPRVRRHGQRRVDPGPVVGTDQHEALRLRAM
jgi:hypothetical protein